MQHVLLSVVVCVLATVPRAAALGSSADRPPNFVMILVDDVGYADLGVQDAKGFKTPNLDRMAAEGTRFTDFYVHPVCGVTRAALMTGCSAMRVAEVGNRKHGHPVLHPDEITVAEVLKSAGYATGMVGKWHLGGPDQKKLPAPELLPNAQGFDYWFGTPTHNGHSRQIGGFKTKLVRNGKLVDNRVDQAEMDTLTRRYTDEAITWIEQHKNEPFFLYIAHNMAHVVLGASEEFRGTSDRGLYGDVMQEFDWSAGRIMETLTELDLDDNTLMVFTSDNGPWVEKHLAGETPRDDHYGRATPLRGYKMTTWEGGPRVPCIFWWPGKVPAGKVCREPATIMDLLPTFAKLAGATPPDDRMIDGRDIWPLISAVPGARSPHEALYYYSFVHLQAVRCGKWKLVRPRPAKPPWCSWSARMTEAVPGVQLYDPESDIGETNNVADQHPDIVTRLVALMERGRKDLGDYDCIGHGQRFFDDGPRRGESARWIGGSGQAAIKSLSFNYTNVTGIGKQAGVCRRDPSDVIKVGDTCYVYYTKVVKDKLPDAWKRLYPSGYPGTVWYAASKDDGRTWEERGEAIGLGEAGTFDSFGVFTPNILAHGGKYWLYYDAVRPTPGKNGVFENNSTNDPTAMGVAVADSPDGPFKRVANNPVLTIGGEREAFDSYRVDDSCLVVRDGKVWLYYKGRSAAHGRAGPGRTRMGVAVSDHPARPFVKQNDGNPVQDSGHEVQVFTYGGGVMSLVSPTGPNGRTLQYAADGLNFRVLLRGLTNLPVAPGLYRPELTDAGVDSLLPTWGISMGTPRGDPYLVRFECVWNQANAGASRPRGAPRFRPLPYDSAKPVGDLRFDFETGDAQGWAVVEGKFGTIVSDRPSLPAWTDVPLNRQGGHHLSTVAAKEGVDDRMTGVIESPVIVLKGEAMSFLVGGGDSDRTYVALCSLDGKELMRAGGTNSPVMRRVNWDVSAYVDAKVVVRIVDRKQKAWAHLTFDDFSTAGEVDQTVTAARREATRN